MNGVGQLAGIWYGINHMVDANERHAQAGERQEQQSERNHAETMAALKGQGKAFETRGRVLQALQNLISLQLARPVVSERVC